MSQYLKRLKAHPGVPIASILTPVFIIAGLANQSPISGVIAGAVASAAIWAIVLWTARDQPIREDES